MFAFIRKLFTRSPKKPVITSTLRRGIVHVNSDVIGEARVSSRNTLGLVDRQSELPIEPFSRTNFDKTHDSSCKMVFMATAISTEASHTSTSDHHSPSSTCNTSGDY